MDSNSFFTERVGHFEEERKLIAKYKLLVTPSKSEIHHLSWETSQQQENVEVAVQELNKVVDEIDYAKKELEHRKEELQDLRDAQRSRQSQLARLSQLAQPIETDVTYMFDEKPLPNGGAGLVESTPKENLAPASFTPKQTKTGDLLLLEGKVHDITRVAYTKFADFDTSFLNASMMSRQCEDSVMQNVQVHIDAARALIEEMGELDQQSFFSVSELLHLRLKIMVAQRMEVEELEGLTKERNYFSAKEKELKEQLLAEMQQMKGRLKHELATCTKELQMQLEAIRAKKERLNDAGGAEQLLDKEKRRPGSVVPKTARSASAPSSGRSPATPRRGTGAAGAVAALAGDSERTKLARAGAAKVAIHRAEMERLDAKRRAHGELLERLKFVKERYYRLKEHYRLEMQGYQTEMHMMRRKLNALMKQQQEQELRRMGVDPANKEERERVVRASKINRLRGGMDISAPLSLPGSDSSST